MTLNPPESVHACALANETVLSAQNCAGDYKCQNIEPMVSARDIEDGND